MILTKIHKLLFYLLIIVLPLNLGKHYEIVDSYVSGILVDYLIPTIYIQDILVLFILIFWFFEILLKKKYKIADFLQNRIIQVSVLFLFSVFLSVLVSGTPVLSLFLWGKLFLYVVFFWYLIFEFDFKKDFKTVVYLFCIFTIFLGILGIFQFINQGAVFNNYLFFGEQPYNRFMRVIVKEIIFGKVVIPPYGLFKHPNIFGGFLSVLLIWIVYFFKEKEKPRSKLGVMAVLTGFLCLILTLSVFSWISFITGIVFLYKIFSKKIIIWTVIFIMIIGLVLPIFSKIHYLEKHPSFYKRKDLILSSYHLSKQNFMYGVGYGSLTNSISLHLPKSIQYLRFFQPVHNIFWLIYAESGVFSLIFFLVTIYTVFVNVFKNKEKEVFLISILQIFVLGSFDHYLLTIHQTFLLLWLILGFAYSAGNNKSAKSIKN